MKTMILGAFKWFTASSINILLGLNTMSVVVAVLILGVISEVPHIFGFLGSLFPSRCYFWIRYFFCGSRFLGVTIMLVCVYLALDNSGPSRR